MKIFDLSQPIYDQMPIYPGDIETHIKQVQWLEKEGYTGFLVHSCLHAGTHLDSPMHLVAGGEGIHQISPARCIGKACVLDGRGKKVINPIPEYMEKVQTGDIVLFLTGWDRYYGKTEYYHEHPELSEAMVDFLVAQKVGMIGLDFPSPDRSPFPVHKKILNEHILILENLTGLEQLLRVKRFEIIALPLKIQAEASMVRVIAREIES